MKISRDKERENITLKRDNLLHAVRNDSGMNWFPEQFGENLFFRIASGFSNLPRTRDNYEFIQKDLMTTGYVHLLLKQPETAGKIDNISSLKQAINALKEEIRLLRKKYYSSQGAQGFLNQYGKQAYKAIIADVFYVDPNVATNFLALEKLHNSGVDYADLANKYFGINPIV